MERAASATSAAAVPVSPKKSLKKAKTRDCLCATSEHISSFSPHCKATPLVIRRATSFTPNNPIISGGSGSGKVVIRGGMASRVRLVSFQKEVQVMGHVPTRGEMTPEDFTNIWYNKDDFKEMKKQYIPIVKKLAKKIPLEEGEEGRGLEHKTPRGGKSRQKNRYQAMDAVLDEQERQWELKRKDADYIAQIYRQSSAHCQMNAYLSAKKDAEWLEQERERCEGEGTRDRSEAGSKNGIVPIPQIPEVRPASFRSRAPEQSPTTPVRKEPGKKVCIQVVVSPSPHILRPE